MAGHTVRVELLDAEEDGDAYGDLHVEMKKKGFKRTIEDGGGDTFHLPPAEYNYEDSDVTTKEVLRKAKAAAERTGHEARIFVTTGKRRWSNLKKSK
jgi:hypothetical protein